MPKAFDHSSRRGLLTIVVHERLAAAEQVAEHRSARRCTPLRHNCRRLEKLVEEQETSEETTFLCIGIGIGKNSPQRLIYMPGLCRARGQPGRRRGAVEAPER